VKMGPRQIGTSQKNDAAHNLIYQQLKEALMNGDFLPGQRLIVRELAERFSTSPMPVRQALQRLTSENALVDLLHRGVLVPEANVEAISDLVRVRCMIEGGAAEWAATTVATREIEELERINVAMLQAAKKKNGAKNYLVLNRRFHFLIYGASRSQALLATIEPFWLRAGPWLNIMRQGAMIGLGLDHHIEVIEGLKTGDGTRARRAIIADISDAADIMMRAASAPVDASSYGRKGLTT
jgi:DNA-binding GntR family transcriptional regulator